MTEQISTSVKIQPPISAPILVKTFQAASLALVQVDTMAMAKRPAMAASRRQGGSLSYKSFSVYSLHSP